MRLRRMHGTLDDITTQGRDSIPGFSDNFALGRNKVSAPFQQLTFQSNHTATYGFYGLH